MTLRKFTLAILLTFTLTIAYQVFAAYLTSPENLKYPNPGHYPGEIGPGTFNCSNNTNCFWKFPNALFINSTSGKVGIGTENPKETLEVQGNTKIQGNLEVTGKGNFYELCIQGNCTTFWPVAGAGGGIGGFKDCEIVERKCVGSGFISCDVSCPSDKWLISGGGICGRHGAGTSKFEGIYESYPKTPGKGGTWHVYGRAYDYDGEHEYIYGYALCCNFTGGAGTVEDIWVNETGDTMTGDLKVEGGIVVGNPTGGNKGPGTINAQKIYVNGSEVSVGRNIDVWSKSVSDSDSCSAVGDTATVNCTIQIPEGYTVIYAHGGKGYHVQISPAGQDGYNNFYADKCAFPSYEKTIMSGGTTGGPTIEGICEELPCLGKKGPATCNLTYSVTCSASAGQTYTYDVKCGAYVIAIKIE